VYSVKITTTVLALLTAMLAGCARETPTAEQPAASEQPGAKEAAAKTAKPPVRRESVIAAGTSLTVRTTNSLSSANSNAGDVFSANLEEPLRDGERVIAPKGADVEGRVVDADKGGRVKGRASISVQLTKLQVGDKTLSISTNTIVRQARATKGKDAAKIGIGSGIGAAIGAIAGGGKGAAIGAGAGAAAGTGVVLGTRGAAAVIPSESVLIFELRSPLKI
jgi:hypothetical protein